MMPGAVILLLCITSFLQAKAECEDRDIQLQSGQLEVEGRVEVCLDGVWGTVRDVMWDDNDARVVCRELGYSGHNATALNRAYFGRAREHVPIHFTKVSCNGSEEKLVNCNTKNVNSDSGWNHCKDVGVRCQPYIPQNVSAAATSTEVTISWRPPALPQSMNVSFLYHVVCSAKISNATSDYKVETRTQEVTLSHDQLLPSTAYNCCVSTGAYMQNFAVCSSITTASATTSNCSAVGGGLGALIAILVLLLIGVIVCIAILYWKKIKASDQACHHRSTSTRNSHSSEDRTWHNPMYDAHSTEAPPLCYEVPNPSAGAQPLNTEIQEPQENPSSSQYSTLGPAYEAIESTNCTTTAAEGQDYSLLKH